ncbi:L-threonylcarbamoyladenylate synthase [bacterium]|nr:L-threonylcarbamoyladenylate synthase [bacterium]
MSVLLNVEDRDHLAFAIRRMREGQPIGIPSETVYGLGGLAVSELALANIFKLKNRPSFDPLIVHVLGMEFLTPYCEFDFELQRNLCEMFWPGPLTILFRKKSFVPDLCTAGSPFVACRAPRHSTFVRVLEALEGEGVAAPSANRFASISPTSAMDVVDELSPFGLEAVFDGGSSKFGIESTVVKVLSESHIEVIRLGAIGIDELRQCGGPHLKVEIRKSGTGIVRDSKSHDAPGQSSRHYSPKTAVFFAEENLNRAIDFSSAALLRILDRDPVPNSYDGPWKRQLCLSPQNDIAEAASQLFKSLRELDRDPEINLIVALPSDGEGISAAIHDRLRRASHR